MQTTTPSESIPVASSKMEASWFEGKCVVKSSICVLWWFARTPHSTAACAAEGAHIQDAKVQYLYLSEDTTPCTVERTHAAREYMNV